MENLNEGSKPLKIKFFIDWLGYLQVIVEEEPEGTISVIYDAFSTKGIQDFQAL